MNFFIGREDLPFSHLYIQTKYSKRLWTCDDGLKDNTWARLLAFVTGLVNQELLLQNEYLAAENGILRAHLPTRLRLSDPQRSRRLVRGWDERR